MRRRALTGRPLLAASAGAALAIGCSGSQHRPPGPVGNLMLPPEEPPQEMVTAKLCVDTFPEEAVVLVNDTEIKERCTEVTGPQGSTVRVVVSADLYETQERAIPLEPELEPLQVLLFPSEVAPVGNLMAPPKR